MFETVLLLATISLTGVLGAVAGYLALKAFKRVRDGSFLLTATGFGLISSATVLGAIGCVFLNIYDVTVHIAQSSAVAIGLLSIIYSISHLKSAERGRVESSDGLRPVVHRHRTLSRQNVSKN